MKLILTSGGSEKYDISLYWNIPINLLKGIE